MTTGAAYRSTAPVRNRPQPSRIYEPNIFHNPFTWMGIWTPHGWRVNKKRFGRAELQTVYLSGDGQTTFFPGALRSPRTGRVEWSDDLHLDDDPFTDTGIYPCDPRVEYPPGRPRWQVSHTLLAGLVADHNLYTHEYLWDMTHGHLYTYFRQRVACESAQTDSRDGRTVRVSYKPISVTIEGNVAYPLNNSAVRGVWLDPQKSSPNLYTRRTIRLLSMHNGVYAPTDPSPVVQCYGLYLVGNGDPLNDLFEPVTGRCTDRQRLQAQMNIPLDYPKLGMIDLKQSLIKVPSRLYETDVWHLPTIERQIDSSDVARVRARVGARFQPGACGYAYEPTRDQSHTGYRGYVTSLDINSDGIIDDRDVCLLEEHAGRCVRYNLYQGAYFGGDWVSTSVATNPELKPGDLVVADYEYGAGYDSQSGTIHLHESPGPNQPVWVEYHHDVPAEKGRDNIVVHIYQETD